MPEKTNEMGQQVLLKLHPYVKSSSVNRLFPKLSYKNCGPFQIVEKIVVVMYKLDLPTCGLSHHVVHVSQLKEFTSDLTPVFTNFP